MPRTYVVAGGQEVDASGGDDGETQLSLATPNDLTAKLLRVRCGQQTHATAEVYKLVLQRSSTAGSGGTTPTPEPQDSGDIASTVTARAGPTTEPTYTAGEILLSRFWNSVLGFEQVWLENKAPTVSPSSFIGAFVSALSGAAVFTPEVEFEFEETGG